MSENDPLAAFEDLFLQERKVQERMEALYERVKEVAQQTSTPPDHEQRIPDDLVQEAVGLRTIWRLEHPEAESLSFVAQFTQFDRIDDEEPAVIPEPEDDESDSGPFAYLSSLRFEMPDHTAVRIRILNETDLESTTGYLDIKPPNAKRYGYVYPEHAGPYLDRADQLLDLYDAAQPGNETSEQS